MNGRIYPPINTLPHASPPRTQIRRLHISGEFPTDMRTPPLEIKILPESNPPKSKILVRRLAVLSAGDPFTLYVMYIYIYVYIYIYTHTHPESRRGDRPQQAMGVCGLLALAIIIIIIVVVVVVVNVTSY